MDTQKEGNKIADIIVKAMPMVALTAQLAPILQRAEERGYQRGLRYARLKAKYDKLKEGKK